jgi:hypothetical protein
MGWVDRLRKEHSLRRPAVLIPAALLLFGGGIAIGVALSSGDGDSAGTKRSTVGAASGGATSAPPTSAPVLTAGNGHHLTIAFEGPITSAATGECHKLYAGFRERDSGEIWLSGGVLHASLTKTPYNQYSGELHRDSWFRLVSSAGGAPSVIVGRIGKDGTVTGTWDTPVPCGVVHTTIDEGAVGTRPNQGLAAFGGH